MRYILKLSYLGENYSGFQLQKNKDTIQSRLESVLSNVIKENIKVVPSGRTDAGVSAMCQVCHFDVEKDINPKRIMSYANTLLPSDIKILEITSVKDDFHARFSSKKKTYEYYFYIGQKNPILDRFATYTNPMLDIDAMSEACKYFMGKHDFSAFCATNTEIKDKIREIYDIKIKHVDGCLYKLSITGGGFLYNMVRIIMGTLVSVGQNKITPQMIDTIIKSLDRSKAGKTMPSKGLILKNVVY